MFVMDNNFLRHLNTMVITNNLLVYMSDPSDPSDSNDQSDSRQEKNIKKIHDQEHFL